VAITEPSNWDTVPVTARAILTRAGGYVDSELAAHNGRTTGVHGLADTALLVDSAEIRHIKRVTQAQYDALTTQDPNTIYLFVASAVASDQFTRTVAAGSWGAADVGGTYTYNTSALTDFSVDGNAGRVNFPAAGTDRVAYLTGVSAQEALADMRFSWSAVPTNGGQSVVWLLRVVDVNNHYRIRAQLAVGGGVQLTLQKNVGGVTTDIVSATTVAGITYTANMELWLRAQVTTLTPGVTTIRAKLWVNGSAEPSAWTVSTTDTETVLQAFGYVGMHFRTGTSQAPLPLTAGLHEFTII
jgi:hypothetical protein